jgi:hypothetical protein
MKALNLLLQLVGPQNKWALLAIRHRRLAQAVARSDWARARALGEDLIREGASAFEAETIRELRAVIADPKNQEAVEKLRGVLLAMREQRKREKNETSSPPKRALQL